MALGLDPATYWQLTPREVHLVEKGRMRWLEAQQEQAIAQAWIMASLSRAERMPGMNELLRPRSREKQSVEEQMIAMQAWAAAVNAREQHGR